MVVFLILLGLAFYFVHGASKIDHQDDNMSDEGWNEKYNR
jgi:hypothetical protein